MLVRANQTPINCVEIATTKKKKYLSLFSYSSLLLEETAFQIDHLTIYLMENVSRASKPKSIYSCRLEGIVVKTLFNELKCLLPYR